MKKSNFLLAGWLMLVGALVPLGAHSQESASCRLTLYSTLPMITNPDGRMSVPVTVQDRNYSFLVDTGGAVATIGWDQAEEIGLKKREAGSYLTGIGGRYLDSYIVTERFSLGKLTGSGLAVYVEPKSDTDFDGTIAPDMMKHYDVDLDFAHGKMNLFSPDHCPGKVVYWNQGNAVVIPMQVSGSAHIRIPVSLDGKVMMAILDTGAVYSIMSVRAASFLGITESDPQLKLKDSYGYRKKTRLYTYPFKALDMGGIVVKNPHIVVGSNDFMGSFDTDMILGMATLRQLHLYIAYGEGKLYITPATAN